MTGDTTTSARQRLVAWADLAERHEQLADIDTAVLEGGQGPPMVLLHGPGEFWAVWQPVIERLRNTHRLVAVDLPGHGASGVPNGRLDRARMMQWLDELIETTCEQPPVLAGHLLGGSIAARYAIGHSRRLAHLVLIDTFGLGWFRPSPRFAIPMVRFIARPTPESRDRFFEECFVDFDRTGANFGDRWDDLRDHALECARHPDNQAALRALMPRFAITPIPADELDAITVPTILIHGRHDLQVPVARAVEASERHGWPLHVIEDARDDPGAEQPDAVVAAIRTALADDATSRSA